MNFDKIKKIFKRHIDKVYDHKFLNDCTEFSNLIPTAEVMSEVFYNKLKRYMKQLYKVEIYETEGASASYEQ